MTLAERAAQDDRRKIKVSGACALGRTFRGAVISAPKYSEI